MTEHTVQSHTYPAGSIAKHFEVAGTCRDTGETVIIYVTDKSDSIEDVIHDTMQTDADKYHSPIYIEPGEPRPVDVVFIPGESFRLIYSEHGPGENQFCKQLADVRGCR
tara:strand:- start:4307 stop:4633 length:327 start_codon:yes stop_codon:yes gene_type:complete